MLRSTITVYTILLLTVAPGASGQEPPSPSGYSSLVEYHQSPDLPNGIAFHSQLSSLDQINTEFGPASAADMVKHELWLSNVEAHTFVSQALTTLYIMKTDTRAQITRLACKFAGPDFDKKDQFAALQQMYDIHKAITDHYFEQTMANLDAETGERFQQWMDEQKLNITSVEVDFEEAYQESGKDPAVTLSGICERDN